MLSRAAWTRILPFMTYMLFIVFADLAQRLGASAEQIRLMYPVKILSVAALLVVFWRHYDELRHFAWRWTWTVIALVSGVLTWWLWVTLDADWMVLGQSSGFDPSRVDGLNWPLVVVRIAGAALVVPIMEELFWRSFLLRWLSQQQFQLVAPQSIPWHYIVVSSILFGIEHNTWLAGVIAGIIYAWIYRRSGNLWVAIFAHAVTNAVLGGWIVLTGSWQYW